MPGPRFRIPKRIVLPFSYIVTIKQVPPGHDLLLDETSGPLDGVWYAEDRLIVINNGLSARRRAYILAHEAQHMLADWQHQLFLDRRARPTGGK